MGRRFLFCFLLMPAVLVGCRQPQPQDVVLHTGRSQSLVAPLIERFAKETGISVSVEYGEGAQMADQIVRDSADASADVLWTSGAGPLGLLQQSGLLTSLPDSLTRRVPEPFSSGEGAWVGLSGRGHVLVYADTLADTISVPQSVFALADSSYDGRIGWSPSVNSFQDLVTTLRHTAGHDSTRKWLKEIYDGGVQVYRQGEIVGAVADDDVTFALTTHDDFYRTRDQEDSLAARITYFRPGDPGNLIDASAIGVLQHSDREQRALRLVRFLLSETAQQHVAANAFEYPLAEGVELDSLNMTGAGRLSELAPAFDLGKLHRRDSTLSLLRDVGIL